MNVTSVCQLSLFWERLPPGLDQGDFRYALDMAVNRVDVQLAEAAGEVALRRGIQRLVFEKQDMALRHRLAQALNRALGQRSRQVDSRHKAADGGRQRGDNEIRGSSHVFTFPRVFECGELWRRGICDRDQAEGTEKLPDVARAQPRQFVLSDISPARFKIISPARGLLRSLRIDAGFGELASIEGSGSPLNRYLCGVLSTNKAQAYARRRLRRASCGSPAGGVVCAAGVA